MGRPRKEKTEEVPEGSIETTTDVTETTYMPGANTSSTNEYHTVLMSYDTHQAARKAYYWLARDGKPLPNGIECPKCGAELQDIHPATITGTWPPQKQVVCSKGCGFKGWRLL